MFIFHRSIIGPLAALTVPALLFVLDILFAAGAQ
jgi:hypothetical protein